MMFIQNLDKKVMIRNSSWPPCPYMVKKHLNNYFSRINGLIWLIFCKKHMGHLPMKKLQFFRQMINRPLVGGVNLENDVKFQIHKPFKLGSLFIIGLLRTMY